MTDPAHTRQTAWQTQLAVRTRNRGEASSASYEMEGAPGCQSRATAPRSTPYALHSHAAEKDRALAPLLTPIGGASAHQAPAGRTAGRAGPAAGRGRHASSRRIPSPT